MPQQPGNNTKMPVYVFDSCWVWAISKNNLTHLICNFITKGNESKLGSWMRESRRMSVGNHNAWINRCVNTFEVGTVVLWRDPDLVFAFTDGFKQSLLGAVKRETPWEEDEEDDSAAPHIHGFPVRLPLHHLRGHEVRSSYTACCYRDRQSCGVIMKNTWHAWAFTDIHFLL